MNKKIERIVIIGLAVFLVGYFVYQVAYGTNESSYKWGFKLGKEEVSNCKDCDADCSGSNQDCAVPGNIIKGGVYDKFGDSKQEVVGPLTNQTGCIDGFVNGWNHVCAN